MNTPASARPEGTRDRSLDQALLDIKCGEDDWLDAYAPYLMTGQGGRGPQQID